MQKFQDVCIKLIKRDSNDFYIGTKMYILNKHDQTHLFYYHDAGFPLTSIVFYTELHQIEYRKKRWKLNSLSIKCSTML